MMSITGVPRTPEFVKGVINSRGKVIPIIDLRLRFGMEAIDYDERTCTIVVEIEGGVKILLDIDKVLYSDELALLKQAA
jgi:purine-binding chemotaxis protein CheW